MKKFNYWLLHPRTLDSGPVMYLTHVLDARTWLFSTYGDEPDEIMFNLNYALLKQGWKVWTDEDVPSWVVNSHIYTEQPYMPYPKNKGL